MPTLPITAQQAHYLNRLAMHAQNYRQAAEYITDDISRQLRQLDAGSEVVAPRRQDMADIVEAAAQIEAMRAMAFSVFPVDIDNEAEVAKVSGYIRQAMTLGRHDYILIEH